MNKLLMFFSGILVLFSTQVYSQNSWQLKGYGLAHLSLDSVDDGQDSNIHTASNSSRLGINGQYSLTNGVNVIFQYESGVDLTGQGENDGNGEANSAGQIFTKTRPSYVGLKGRLGKIVIGHMPALDQWANDYNLFADQVGDLGNLWEGSGVPGRMDNTLHYASPDFNGFDFAFTYQAKEHNQDQDNFIFKANFLHRNVTLGIAYASIGQSYGFDEHQVVAATIGYRRKNYTLGGGYQLEHDISGISGHHRESFTLGASMHWNSHSTVKAQFAITKGEFQQSDASQIAVGYDYALTEKTNLYIAYAYMNNEQAVSFSVNGKGHGDKIIPLLGDDPRALSIGIVTKFDISFSG